jgi:hypothetical protein
MADPPLVRMHLDHLALVWLPPDDPIPGWLGGALYTLVRTPSAVSIFCDAKLAPEAVVHSQPWCCLELVRTGLSNPDAHLSVITASLRRAKADLFVVSAVETDYFFVRPEELGTIIGALNREGYTFVE